ncbi:MAG: biotin transporter BioY [Anaerolineae bacterium]|nr:biotin transporter BioY [Anaerolineae bacterium]
MESLVLRRQNVSTWVRVLGILLFATLTALSARVSVPLPFSPVPLTLQVLVVVLSGFILGARGGLLAQGLYLQAILFGAPLTALGLAGPAAFLSPTAGYLIAFPLAAWLAGKLSERVAGVYGRALGGLAALVAIYALGAAWLSGFVGGISQAWRLGVAPFAGADALKVLLAVAALSVRKR